MDNFELMVAAGFGLFVILDIYVVYKFVRKKILKFKRIALYGVRSTEKVLEISVHRNKQRYVYKMKFSIMGKETSIRVFDKIADKYKLGQEVEIIYDTRDFKNVMIYNDETKKFLKNFNKLKK